MESECELVLNEIEKIEKDFITLNKRLEIVVVQLWEAEFRIKFISEENKDLNERKFDLNEKIKELENEINDLLKKLNGNDTELRKSQIHTESLRLFRIKQEINNLLKEKIETITKIQKMKENESIKNRSISMLMNKLASVTKISNENGEKILIDEAQEQKIYHLEHKISTMHRRCELENQRCSCSIY